MQEYEPRNRATVAVIIAAVITALATILVPFISFTLPRILSSPTPVSNQQQTFSTNTSSPAITPASTPTGAAIGFPGSTSQTSNPPTASPTPTRLLFCGGQRSGDWTPIQDGPADCNYQAWDVRTPASPSLIFVDYPIGIITKPENYVLYVYITASASAYVNYDPEVNGAVKEPCHPSSPAPSHQPGWERACIFSVTGADVGQMLSIHEWTGQITEGFVMSDAAIELESIN